MKKILLYYIRCIIVTIVVFLLLCSFSLLIDLAGKIDKLPDPDRVSTLFYYLPSNSVDILFLGDSHSYCTYISQDIYDQTKITSASVATSSNSIINQYWQLKEALKKQKIKMAVLETHPLELAGGNQPSRDYLHFTSGISIIPDYSINKLKCYIDMKKHSYGISNEISYSDIYNFTRYKEDLQRNNNNTFGDCISLFINPASQFETFGYYPVANIEIVDKKYTTYEGNNEYIDFSSTLEYEYLMKIYDLCKNNNIELVLSRAIYYSNCDLHFINDQIDQWAKNNNVDVIDYFKLIDDCGFDFNTDFRDKQHFNYLGAKKATNYFINYLEKKNITGNCDPIKRKLWEENNFDYNRIEKEMLESITS